jgi:UDP-glucose 6-dehydrogenase
MEFSPAGGSATTSLTAKLGIPFGTIAKLEAEIYDGYNFHDKGHEDMYLLKINSINGKIIKGILILPFDDETKTLANDVFSLYELIYKKKADEISEAQLAKMKKQYVGKKVTIMAYETGDFIGMPQNYQKYRLIRQDRGFIFMHNLIVVANLKK